ncbi:MAG TPA: phosphoribosylglycinamide formyltransferase [Spirochaetales bacterium]|nr:phosphoribosylglycinamide formyltransferase [Spirochaetales bacterium]HRY53785.1 phosphoribosylglycinamide formyltransferase [Spirochaetia bacterium]HRZ64973.1 phosphoribosylglycinamide formyltransferase [Spirochaetia bacterium]
MARLAVLASGNGSNFQAIVEALRAAAAAGGRRHGCVLLVHDRRAAYAAERARALGVPARYLPYAGRSREEAEAELAAALDEAGAELVALAGFMRLLSPAFVAARRGRVVNVHPAVLPAWPGAGSIRRAYEAGAAEFGATVHFVDEGMDTGPILIQEAFRPAPGSSLAEIERATHEIEHRIYPRAVLGLLDAIEAEGRA